MALSYRQLRRTPQVGDRVQLVPFSTIQERLPAYMDTRGTFGINTAEWKRMENKIMVVTSVSPDHVVDGANGVQELYAWITCNDVETGGAVHWTFTEFNTCPLDQTPGTEEEGNNMEVLNNAPVPELPDLNAVEINDNTDDLETILNTLTADGTHNLEIFFGSYNAADVAHAAHDLAEFYNGYRSNSHGMWNWHPDVTDALLNVNCNTYSLPYATMLDAESHGNDFNRNLSVNSMAINLASAFQGVANIREWTEMEITERPFETDVNDWSEFGGNLARFLSRRSAASSIGKLKDVVRILKAWKHINPAEAAKPLLREAEYDHAVCKFSYKDADGKYLYTPNIRKVTAEDRYNEPDAETREKYGIINNSPRSTKIGIRWNDYMKNVIVEDVTGKLIPKRSAHIVNQFDIGTESNHGSEWDLYERHGRIYAQAFGEERYQFMVNCGNIATCPDCGREIVVGSDAARYTHNDLAICLHCVEANYTVCSRCGRAERNENVSDWHTITDAYSTATYCPDCYEEVRWRSYIESYGFKPSPRFHSMPGADENNRLKMGLELEVDAVYTPSEDGYEDSTADGDNSSVGERGRVRASTKLHELDENMDLMYQKRDGSLSQGGEGGIEIVTHPCTLEFHRQKFPWHEVIKVVKEEGFRSDKTKTCGLHIHVSRKGLGDNATERQLTIAKLILVYDNLWEKLVKFSRRDRSQLDRWARKPDSNIQKGDTQEEVLEKAEEVRRSNCCGHNGRYRAINLQNEQTVEFRMFRGTLNSETLFATLELTQLLCDYCKDHSVEEVMDLTWAKLVEIGCEKYPEFKGYVNRKHLLR